MVDSVWVGSTELRGAKAYNIYFKQKLNQVGRFEFYAVKNALSTAERALLVPGAIVRISVAGTIRFEGYISIITEDKSGKIYEIEGYSLAGILNTRTTRTPVALRGGVDGDLITGKQIVQQAVFRFGGFATTGNTGWSITGGDGVDTYFYKFESKSILDHVVGAAKSSGYDWRVYIDEGA